jgi:hypothetical protein
VRAREGGEGEQVVAAALAPGHRIAPPSPTVRYAARNLPVLDVTASNRTPGNTSDDAA